MPTIAYQLYSSRNWPFAETLDMLERVGFEAVEGFGPQFEDPAATRAALDARELAMPTAHFAGSRRSRPIRRSASSLTSAGSMSPVTTRPIGCASCRAASSPST